MGHTRGPQYCSSSVVALRSEHVVNSKDQKHQGKKLERRKHQGNIMSKSLTKNQTLVLDTLTASTKPQTAYSLLDQLKDHGLKAPPQIYRALEKLLELGLVHKLESINSFVACQHNDCAHQIAGFAICDGCDRVAEIIDDRLELQIHAVAKTAGLVPKKSTMEIHGLCSSCEGSEA